MSFNLLQFLSMFLGGLKIDGIEQAAVTWLKEKGANYPDLSSRADALAAWLHTTIAESTSELDPSKMAFTLRGIAADVVSGAAGVDHKAGHITG
jgi:hypothetical protein